MGVPDIQHPVAFLNSFASAKNDRALSDTASFIITICIVLAL